MGRYACEHAYFAENRTGRQFILCDRNPAPDMGNAKAIIHAMCPYQKPCKMKVNCGLTDGWRECIKLREMPAAKPETAVKKPKTKRKKAE